MTEDIENKMTKIIDRATFIMQACPSSLVYLYNAILRDNPCPPSCFAHCTNSQIYIYLNMYYMILRDRNN